MATEVDTSGLYAGRREAMGIIKAMASPITSFDVFSGIGISAATAFASAAKSAYNFEKEFHKNMLEVATISTQVSGSMADFMNRVLSITRQIPIAAPEAARALYQIVLAGHDGAAGMQIPEVAARANGSESKFRELVPEIEAVNGVLGMTGKNAKAAASDLGELQNSAGATGAAFEKMQEDVDNQMKLLSNNIHAALRPMGEAILKNVSEAAQMINKGFETGDGDVQNSLESLKKLLMGVAGGIC